MCCRACSRRRPEYDALCLPPCEGRRADKRSALVVCTLGRMAEARAHSEVFFESPGAFLRALPAQARRFWILVIVVGVLAGLSAAGLVQFLKWVQHLAWSQGSEGLLGATQQAS